MLWLPILFTITILLTKITDAQNEVALSYHRVRGLYFVAIIFAATIKFNRSIPSFLMANECRLWPI